MGAASWRLEAGGWRRAVAGSRCFCLLSHSFPIYCCVSIAPDSTRPLLLTTGLVGELRCAVRRAGAVYLPAHATSIRARPPEWPVADPPRRSSRRHRPQLGRAGWDGARRGGARRGGARRGFSGPPNTTRPNVPRTLGGYPSISSEINWKINRPEVN